MSERRQPHPTAGPAAPSPAPYPPDVWARLRAPFAGDDVLLTDVRLDPDAGRGVARPVVRTAALVERLDAVLGPGGWDCAFALEPGGAVRCTLRIGPASCGGLAHGPDLAAAQGAALRRAARLFGIARGLDGSATVAVEADAFGAVDGAKAAEALAARGLVAPSTNAGSGPASRPGPAPGAGREQPGGERPGGEQPEGEHPEG